MYAPPASDDTARGLQALWGETVYGDGLTAISRLSYATKRLEGAISLLWSKSYLSSKEFAAQYLADLTRTTDRIIAALPAATTEPDRTPP